MSKIEDMEIDVVIFIFFFPFLHFVIYHKLKNKQKKATCNSRGHGVLEGPTSSLTTKQSHVKDKLLQLRNTHTGNTTYLAAVRIK